MGKKKRPPARKKRRGRPPIKEITEPQRRALAAIKSFTALKGYAPTVRELAAELSSTPGSVHGLINQLVRKGYLRRSRRKARSLEVVATPKHDPERLVPVKIVGDVAAGSGILAEENVVGEVLVEARAAGRSDCFALRVRGDSMTGAGIDDGDLCIVRRQPAADSGEIVVVLKGEEGLVKRLRISEDGVELVSENPKYDPLPVGPDEDFRILGKVIAVRRQADEGGEQR